MVKRMKIVKGPNPLFRVSKPGHNVDTATKTNLLMDSEAGPVYSRFFYAKYAIAGEATRNVTITRDYKCLFIFVKSAAANEDFSTNAGDAANIAFANSFDGKRLHSSWRGDPYASPPAGVWWNGAYVNNNTQIQLTFYNEFSNTIEVYVALYK